MKEVKSKRKRKTKRERKRERQGSGQRFVSQIFGNQFFFIIIK